MPSQFTDSCHDNFELIKELLRAMPGTAQKRARTAANRVVEIWEKNKAEAPNDPAVAVGTAFAVFFIAQHIIESPKEDAISDNIIERVGSNG